MNQKETIVRKKAKAKTVFTRLSSAEFQLRLLGPSAGRKVNEEEVKEIKTRLEKDFLVDSPAIQVRRKKFLPARKNALLALGSEGTFSFNSSKTNHFITCINVVRWVNRLRIRTYSYGSVERNPKLITKNGDIYFNRSRVIEESIIKLSWYIINPNSTWKFIWNVCIFFLSLYVVIIIPIRFCFYNNFLILGSKYLYFDILVEIVFIIDFVMNFFCAQYNQDQIVTDIREIILNYAFSWMLFDFLSVFPFYFVIWGKGNPKEIDFHFILLKMIKIFHVLSIIHKIERSKYMVILSKMNNFVRDIIKVLRFIFISFMICNIFACLWYVIAKKDPSPDSWLYKYGLFDCSPSRLYIKSIYFSFTVFLTVGYGDIVPYSNKEVIILSFYIIISGIYYSYNLSLLGTVFTDTNEKGISVYNINKAVKEIAKKNQIDLSLREKISKYLVNEFSNQSKADNVDIFRDLSVDLKSQIVLNIYNQKIKQFPIFSECKKEFVANFVLLLEKRDYPKGATIYKEKEVPDFMYFILEGEVCLSTSDDIVFSTVKEGSYFGEIEILRRLYRESNAKAKTDTSLLLMKREIIFQDVFQSDNNFLTKLVETMIKRIRNNKKLIKNIHDIINYGKTVSSEDKNHPSLEGQKIAKFFFDRGLQKILNKENFNMKTENVETLLNNIKKETLESVQQNARIVSQNMRRLRSSVFKNAKDFQNVIKFDFEEYKIEYCEQFTIIKLRERDKFDVKKKIITEINALKQQNNSLRNKKTGQSKAKVSFNPTVVKTFRSQKNFNFISKQNYSALEDNML